MKPKISKGFIGFLSGIVFTLFVGAIVIPMYCDYQDRATTDNLLKNIFPRSDIAHNIERKVLSNQTIQSQTFNSIDKTFDKKSNLQFGYVNELGEVFIKFGRSGQVILLKPQVVNKQVQWLCVGGDDKAMPYLCRGRTGFDNNNPIPMQKHN